MTGIEIESIRRAFKDMEIEEFLAYVFAEYGDRAALSSSLGAEDQVLTHMILAKTRSARIFTMDTGRLFQETYDLVQETMARYSMYYEIYFPDYADVERIEREKGPNCMYDSVALRKECCRVRKVLPLERALSKTDVWITGLRRDQSDGRKETEGIEWLGDRCVAKVNPLVEWTWDEVMAYVRDNGVPYNRLHDQGFPSVGCAPCTRAVREGEDPRSGRWWWETAGRKECGLHERHGRRT